VVVVWKEVVWEEVVWKEVVWEGVVWEEESHYRLEPFSL